LGRLARRDQNETPGLVCKDKAKRMVIGQASDDVKGGRY
jgi:hypothetical protein